MNNMKKFTFIIVAFFIAAGSVSAQDVTIDEIIDSYFENTGGLDNWKALKGIKMTAKLNQGGIEIPLEIVQLADGRQYTKFNVQGNDFYQGVFDGETLWSINFQSLKAEKSDQEATDNFKLNLNDFPDSFIDYKKKGYQAELMGTEIIDGAETYKIKLTKEPIMVNGEQKEDITFYYFDSEAFVPIAQDSEIKEGPQAGQLGRATQSDFDEVEGLYFPFSLGQGIVGGQMQPIMVESIEVNPEVDESVFAYPGE